MSNINFGYDGASRLQTVTHGTAVATYTYLANSPMVQQILLQQRGATRMTVSKQYEFLNRLTQVSSVPSADATASCGYLYNLPREILVGWAPHSKRGWLALLVGRVHFRDYLTGRANQHSRVTLIDGSYWVFSCDSLGQVTAP